MISRRFFVKNTLEACCIITTMSKEVYPTNQEGKK